MIVSRSGVDKFPVVIIGPPRSGSNVVCRQIATDLNLPWFNDITYVDKSEFVKFSEFIQTTDQYVVKFHAMDLLDYPNILIDKINNNQSYNIKIVRKNKVEQLASVYLSEIRKTYTYDRLNLDMYADEIIKIEKMRLARCLNRMHKNYLELENLKVSFDKVVIYEDYIYDSGSVMTPKPKNYNDLLNLILEDTRNIKWFNEY